MEKGNVTLQAMALNIPDTPGHPNKHPFKGILTRIDQPSDNPPSGANGKRVVLPKAVADKALPTLLGMPVDMKAGMSGHDKKSKVGTITAATIEGDAIHIEGFLFAADFPDEVGAIQSQRDELGFSWELQCRFEEQKDVLVITECVFTGAAILYKDKAAYQTTSLAAQAEEIAMSKEILEALDGLKKDINDKVDAIGVRMDKLEASAEETKKEIHAGKEHMSKVEPHAAALEKVAGDMEKGGIGGHPVMGHVHACRAMADHLRSSAAVGKLADMWPGQAFMASSETKEVKETKNDDSAKDAEIADLKAKLAASGTKCADLEAAAKKASPAPERKTMAPGVVNLMAKAGVALPEEGKTISVSEIDGALSKSTLSTQQRLEVKAAMHKAGQIA